MGFKSYKSYGSQVAIPKVSIVVPVALSAYRQLLVNKPPWGRYDASQWSGTTLPEVGGNTTRNATTSGTFTKGSLAGNGASAAIAYLAGSATSKITWTDGSIPTTFTICSIARYVQGGSTLRIFVSTLASLNWLHGFWKSNRGVCYYESQFQTAQVSVGNLTDWLTCCGTNNSVIQTPNNILLDGVPSGVNNGGSSGGNLAINNAPNSPAEVSDFQFSQLIIFDQALTAAEMVIVSNALQNYKATGVLDTPIPLPKTITGLQLWLDATDTSSLSLTGSTLTQWNDKSGNGRNATPFDGLGSPSYNATGFNSFPSIQFSATTGMASPIPLNTLSAGCSVFMIFQKNGVQSTTNGLIAMVKSFTPLSPSPFEMYETVRVSGNGENFQYHTNGFNLGTATGLNLFSMLINPSSYKEYLNGSLSSQQSPLTYYASTGLNFIIGSHDDKKFTGVISEIIVYNSSLSTSQQQTMEGYLAWKYNINSQLPSGHPYYTLKPN